MWDQYERVTMDEAILVCKENAERINEKVKVLDILNDGALKIDFGDGTPRKVMKGDYLTFQGNHVIRHYAEDFEACHVALVMVDSEEEMYETKGKKAKSE